MRCDAMRRDIRFLYVKSQPRLTYPLEFLSRERISYIYLLAWLYFSCYRRMVNSLSKVERSTILGRFRIAKLSLLINFEI